MKTLEYVAANASQKFIAENCLYLTRSGSQAYNTNIDTSDEDIKGITLAPKDYLLGFADKFEQWEHRDPDMAIFALQKYMGLLLNSNPNILEMLFVDPSDVLYVHPLFQEIINHRDEVLSQKCYYSFANYARGQLQRLQNHFDWNQKDPVKPDPSDYGIIVNSKHKALYDTVAAEIRKETDKSLFNGFENQNEMSIAFRAALTDYRLAREKVWESQLERFVGTEEVYESLIKYKKYEKDLMDYNKFVDWKKKRNPQRAESEKKMGFDGKFGYHVARLYTMCKEILTDQKVIVKRVNDRDLYLDIRNGKYSYEEFMEMAKKLGEENEVALKNSKLRVQPDKAKFNKLVVDLCDKFYA